MDLIVNQERRFNQRNYTSLSAIVKGQDSGENFWKETAVISTVSRTGAGFNLQRECQIGRLISLILPMPIHLRCYDTDTELYRVWGLVQHCNPISNEKYTGYQIGIAFTGKYAPESFKINPLHSYRISGVSETGLWKIIEAQRDFVTRKNPRFNIEIEINIAVLDSDGNITAEENTKTENVSICGAAVISTLKVTVGEQINYTCAKYNFSSLAVVRNQTPITETTSLLHLEFINNVFPVREVFLPIEKVEEVREAVGV